MGRIIIAVRETYGRIMRHPQPERVEPNIINVIIQPFRVGALRAWLFPVCFTYGYCSLTLTGKTIKMQPNGGIIFRI